MAIIAVLVGAALVTAFTHRDRVASILSRAHSGGDFVAFYCAGDAVAHGSDPYTIEPLRTCEHEHDSLGANTTFADVTPAPLPPYDLAFFALLSRVPYGPAAVAWYAVLLGCFVVTVVTLARITLLPWYIAFAALAIPYGYANLVFAQLPPVAVAALCLAAYLVRVRRYNAAGVVAAIAMFEPHIGLPAVLAMLVFLPPCRFALVASLATLGVTSIFAVGVPINIAYFREVLPLQALAEVGTSDQLSLTWILHWFGVTDHAAIAAGSASYVFMTLVGLILARSAAKATAEKYLLVLVPPALAMFGGAYVHPIQLAAAVPAALALAALSKTHAPLAWSPVILLSLPWQGAWSSRAYMTIAVLSLIVLTSYAWRLLPTSRRAFAVAAATAAFLLTTFGLQHAPTAARPSPSPAAFYASLGAERRLAGAAWGVRVRRDAYYSDASLRTLAQKIPPWIGLALLLGVAARASRAKETEDRRS